MKVCDHGGPCLCADGPEDEGTPRFAVLDGFGNVWSHDHDGEFFTRISAIKFAAERNAREIKPSNRVVRLDIVWSES